MLETGLTIKCTVRDSILGKMEGSIVDSTYMIKSMALESILGPTGESTLDSGSIVRGMEKEK